MKEKLYAAARGGGGHAERRSPFPCRPQTDVTGGDGAGDETQRSAETLERRCSTLRATTVRRSPIALRWWRGSVRRTMLTFRDTWEWDIAAGVILIEEAGRHSQRRCRRAHHFQYGKPMAPGVMAAPGALHEALLRSSAGGVNLRDRGRQRSRLPGYAPTRSPLPSPAAGPQGRSGWHGTSSIRRFIKS
jgi:myo-inositol-1(or 4)-monophosphatase